MPEVETLASDPTMTDPGWSNNPPGPAAEAPPAVEPLVMTSTPGWSNNPPGPTTPTPTEQTPTFPLPGWSNSGAAATGATAGSPGSYTPVGAIAPLSLSALTGVTASPATAWTVGQYVVTRDGQYAHWSSTAWVIGKA